MKPPLDVLTLLTDAGGKPLGKCFVLRGGKISETVYPRAVEFWTRLIPFDDFEGFAAALDRAAREGIAAAVRAEAGPFFPRDNKPVFRLLHADEGLAYANGRRVPKSKIDNQSLVADGEKFFAVTWLPMFVDTPRRWVIFDVDRLDPATGLDDWPHEIEATIEHVLSTFPEAFREASCWYSLSSSAIKPTIENGAITYRTNEQIRLKLAFLLDRPLTGVEIEGWMKVHGTRIDPATLRPVQLTYIASPTFGPGLHDPLPSRTGIWRGLQGLVEVPVELPRPARYEADEEEIDGTAIDAADLEALESSLRARIDNGAHVREHILAAIKAYLRQHGKLNDAAIKALAGRLQDVASEFRSAGEVRGYGVARIVRYYNAKVYRPANDVQFPGDAGPEPYYSAEELAPEEASERLRQVMAATIDQALAWKEGDDAPPVTAIKAPAGLGKTITVFDILKERFKPKNAFDLEPGLHVEFYVPTLHLAEEIVAAAESRGIPAVAIRGRGKKPANNPEGMPLCTKHKEAETVAHAGFSVFQTMCEGEDPNGFKVRCEFFEECPYLAQFKNTSPRVRVMTHAYMGAKRPKLPSPDLVVIDESFWQQGVRQTDFCIDRLRAARASRMRPEHEAEIMDVAYRVHDALEKDENPACVTVPEEFSRLAALEMSAVNGPPVHPGMPHTAQKKLLAGLQKAEAFKLAAFWRVLACDAKLNRPTQRVVLVRNVRRANEQQDRIYAYWRDVLKLPNRPVILLDASLDERIVRKFFPDLVVETIAARRNCTVTQIGDTPCSKTRLLSYDTAIGEEKARAERRLADVQNIIEGEAQKGTTLVVAPLKVTDRLRSIPGADMAHYNGLRGIDAYKEHERVVLVSREEPAASEIESLARALFGDDDGPLDLPGIYHKAFRGYRLRCGQKAGANVTVHPDERCQALLEQIREREMEQDIDRLRLVHRTKPASVLVLSNIVLDLTVDRLTQWRDLLPDRMQQTAMRLGGCLPLSPSELARLAPDIWRNAKAAKAWLRRAGIGTTVGGIAANAARENGIKGVHSPIRITIGVCTPFRAFPRSASPATFFLSPHATLAEYRTMAPGGGLSRGTAHRVWVLGEFWCPDALAGYLQRCGFGPVKVTDILDVVHGEPEPAAAEPVELTVATEHLEPEPPPPDLQTPFRAPPYPRPMAYRLRLHEFDYLVKTRLFGSQGCKAQPSVSAQAA